MPKVISFTIVFLAFTLFVPRETRAENDLQVLTERVAKLEKRLDQQFTTCSIQCYGVRFSGFGTLNPSAWSSWISDFSIASAETAEEAFRKTIQGCKDYFAKNPDWNAYFYDKDGNANVNRNCKRNIP